MEDVSVDVLLREAEDLGHDSVVMPFEIMNLSMRLSTHRDALSTVVRLTHMIEDDSFLTRHTAIRALRLIGPAGLTTEVVSKSRMRLYYDPNAAVRAEAVRVLMDSTDRSAEVLKSLEYVADYDEVDWVRGQAVDALTAIKHQRA